MRRSIIALSISAATLGALALGTAPAAAAVPEGDTLYGIACPYYSTDDSQFPPLQLIEFDSATAEGTLVGSGTPALSSYDCAYQGAWNPVTQTAYAVAQQINSSGALVSIDLTTGVSTKVGDFLRPILAIAIGLDGTAYAIDSSTLYSLDLSNAALTEIGATISADSMAVDPSTGSFYVLQDSGYLYRLDTSTGGSELIGYVGQGGTYSFTIDTAGVAWYVNDRPLGGNDWEGDLYSYAFADSDADAVLSGPISVGAANPYVEGLLLTWAAPPEPALAATGSDSGPASIVALGAGALLLLVGGAFAARARRAATSD